MNIILRSGLFFAALAVLFPSDVLARGGGGLGGGGGGGARGGGGLGGGAGAGGGMRGGAGGAGGARPGGMGEGTHSPSFSRPSTPNQAGGNRPNAREEGNRPGGEGSLPGGNRPGISNRPDGGNLAGSGNRPATSNWASSGNRNAIENRSNNNFNNVGNRTNNVVVNNNHVGVAANRSYNNDWHHGYWNGNYNHGGAYARGYANGYSHGYWDRPWYAQPAVWGMSAWALGSMAYGSGYSSYSNPYYAGDASSAGTYSDYSVPIQTSQQTAAAQPADADPNAPPAQNVPPEVAAAMPIFDKARDDFKQGDYKSALKNVDAALVKLPTDAALHEFRGLVQFALKDYSNAAATVYAVLSVGPGWDWTTLSSMYASSDTYSEQLRALEQTAKEKPKAADVQFLLAYHYITCGHTEAAIKKLQQVVKLKPDDQLSPQLVKMLGGSDAGQAAPQPPAIGDDGDSKEPPEPPAVDAAKIVGNWKAKNAGGTSFTLALGKDSKFTWGSERGGKKQEFSGKYTVDGAYLVLERADGDTMPGQVTLASNGFNFKLYGGPADDPGLDFKK